MRLNCSGAQYGFNKELRGCKTTIGIFSSADTNCVKIYEFDSSRLFTSG